MKSSSFVFPLPLLHCLNSDGARKTLLETMERHWGDLTVAKDNGKQRSMRWMNSLIEEEKKWLLFSSIKSSSSSSSSLFCCRFQSIIICIYLWKNMQGLFIPVGQGGQIVMENRVSDYKDSEPMNPGKKNARNGNWNMQFVLGGARRRRKAARRLLLLAWLTWSNCLTWIHPSVRCQNVCFNKICLWYTYAICWKTVLDSPCYW